MPHRVGIASPFEEGGVFATVELSNASVSSSGTYLRKWKIGADEFRHIVFPTSVRAGEECASVTVIDPLGAVSDAFATAIFAAGAKKGMDIALSAGIDALVVKEDRKIVTTPGFDEKYVLRAGLPSVETR